MIVSVGLALVGSGAMAAGHKEGRKREGIAAGSDPGTWIEGRVPRECALRFSRPKTYSLSRAFGLAGVTVADLGNGHPDIVVTHGDNL